MDNGQRGHKDKTPSQDERTVSKNHPVKLDRYNTICASS